MNYVISTRLMQSEEMTRGEYNTFRGWTIPENENPHDKGYKVVDNTGHVSWIPLEQYERNFLRVDENKKLPSGVSVGAKMVEDFIKEKHVSTIGGKTTLVRVVLKNGFEIIESSACVDPANYSEEIGAECCLEKIKDKIWYLLGFLIQTAYHGVK